MLALTRQIGESIIINDNIKIKVVKLSNSQVRLAFDAPLEVSIKREELLWTKRANKDDK